MSDPKLVAAVVLSLLVGGGVAYALATGGEDMETVRLTRQVDSLSSELDEAKRALAVVDSAAAVEIREARQERARLDTVWQSSVDTLMAAVPDTLRPALERLLRADSAEDAAYEREIRALEEQVEVRDSVIARYERQAAAQAELVAHLKSELNPTMLERVFGGVGEGAVRVGVIGVALAVDRPGAAAGAGAMWVAEIALE